MERKRGSNYNPAALLDVSQVSFDLKKEQNSHNWKTAQEKTDVFWRSQVFPSS